MKNSFNLVPKLLEKLLILLAKYMIRKKGKYAGWIGIDGKAYTIIIEEFFRMDKFIEEHQDLINAMDSENEGSEIIAPKG
jgi:hypothetical protein